jgi:flagellar protein FlbD
MIQLTRLNHHPLAVNSDLIKFVEPSPDTVITLVSGEKIVVLEPPDEVLRKIVEFRRSILRGLVSLWAEPRLTALAEPGSDAKI